MKPSSSNPNAAVPFKESEKSRSQKDDTVRLDTQKGQYRPRGQGDRRQINKTIEEKGPSDEELVNPQLSSDDEDDND